MIQSQTHAAPRILIVRTGAMGDILHAMPAVAALRSHWPEAKIGWVVEPHWSPLLQASDGSMPLIDKLLFASTREWSKKPFSSSIVGSILQLRRELRSANYDLAIDLQGSIRSAVIARMSGAKRIIGPADPRESQARWLYRETAPTAAAHVIDQACEIVSAAVQTKLAAMTAPLPVDPSAEAWATQQVCGNDVFLAPSAGWGAKQWPADRYGQLAHTLAQNGYSVLVNAVSPNDPLAQAVVSASQGTARLVVASIGQLIALTRRMKLVVAGDTGPLHLAAALRVPVVAIFGPTDPQRNGPYGTRRRVIRNPASIRDHRRHTVPEAGLLRITTEEVTAAALGLLNEATA